MWEKIKFSFWLTWVCFVFLVSCLFKKNHRTLVKAGISAEKNAEGERAQIDWLDNYCRKEAGFKPKEKDKNFFMAFARMLKQGVD